MIQLPKYAKGVPYLTIEGALRRHRQLGQTVSEQNVRYLCYMPYFPNVAYEEQRPDGK